MSVEVLRCIAIVSLGFSGVFCMGAAVLFVKYRIPAVIGQLTGHTAKKTIAVMKREGSHRNGEREGRSSSLRREESKVLIHVEIEYTQGQPLDVLQLGAD